jgi:inosine-uridine nucleoside N-ribohydrolase
VFTRNGATLAVLLMFGSFGFGKVPIVFDTDIGNDTDDALALATPPALMDRVECHLIGVTPTNANPAARSVCSNDQPLLWACDG